MHSSRDRKYNVGFLYFDNYETSRERPKSAPYLCSKIAKGLQSVKYSLLQYPHEEKNERKNRFFFQFFLVPVKSHSAEKCKRGPQKSQSTFI